LLFGVGIALAMGLFGSRKSMANLREQMRDPNLSEEDRRALWQQMRDQRGGEDFGPRGGGRGGGDVRIKKVLAMAPADQLKEMDKDIDEMVKREKQREERDKAQAAKDAKDGKPANPAGGGRGGRGGPPDPNAPNAWRNRMTSSTPADARANRTISRELSQAYREMLQQRANQRGVNIPNGGR
jgi:hypothetical protein